LRRSGGQPFAALGAAARNDLPAFLGRHAFSEAVPAFADDFARLIGTLHGCVFRDEFG
jgi:hypothetical protein